MERDCEQSENGSAGLGDPRRGPTGLLGKSRANTPPLACFCEFTQSHKISGTPKEQGGAFPSTQSIEMRGTPST